MRRLAILGACSVALANAGLSDIRPDIPMECSYCEQWNQPQEPFRVYGNTFYVGTAELSSILIVGNAENGSPELALINGALPQSAELIAANIRKLGFEIEHIRFILNSHAHFDHAGGINALQRASGAKVLVSERSLSAFESGQVPADDPQAGFAPENAFPAVANLQVIADGGSLRVGETRLTVHYTPGHTPGSSSWSWRSCEASECLNVIYADSLSPVSDDEYRFSDSIPSGFEDVPMADLLRESIEFVGDFDCDILLAPHHFVFHMHEKLEERSRGESDNPFVQAQDCRDYEDDAKRKLEKRLAEEKERPD